MRVVGRGSTWILNMPPNTTGVIPEEYAREVRLLGTAVRASFDASIVERSDIPPTHCADLEIILHVPKHARFDAVMLQENLAHGP